MKHEFRHRFTDAVLHTEEVPDDVPNVLRVALEQAAIRGRPAEELRDLRDATESKLEDDDIENAERKLLQRLIEAIDRELLAPLARANMRDWHLDGECGTTHCRAGWAIHLAGKAGYELERELGSAERAGAQIYMASVGFTPWFYDPSDENALNDIRRCAAEQTAASSAAAAPAAS